MDYLEAIDIRSSRRTYTDQIIEPDKVVNLNQLIDEANEESGLNFHLYTREDDGIAGLKMSYGMFKNVHNYISLIGKKEDPDLKEKIGYFGEKIVLYATTLNLGTCWVGGTFDKKSCKCKVGEDEILLGIITIGYVEEKRNWKEALVRNVIRRKTKTIEVMLKALEEVPQWVNEGMRAVQKAPSAVNGQPVHFEYRNGNILAYVNEKFGIELMDLGIAKLHFELGSGNIGTWKFGNHGMYCLR